MSAHQKILSYMDDHSDIITLKDIARHFGYHPNYVSSLLHKETGRTFSACSFDIITGCAAVCMDHCGYGMIYI